MALFCKTFSFVLLSEWFPLSQGPRPPWVIFGYYPVHDTFMQGRICPRVHPTGFAPEIDYRLHDSETAISRFLIQAPHCPKSIENTTNSTKVLKPDFAYSQLFRPPFSLAMLERLHLEQKRDVGRA
jgi:hypothetical protein